MNRRHFLKLLGYAPFVVPLSVAAPGCSIGPIGNQVTVSLVKNDDEAAAISRAIELAGGLDFIAPGDSVLLKVALNSANVFPATTSPFLIAQLISLLKDRGAGTIYVGDKSPTWQDTTACLNATGIYQAAVDGGAEIVVFEDADMVPVKPEAAVCWPDGFSVPSLFNRVHHIIALPTLRTHMLADFTMGMKIFVGAIPQEQRNAMHRSPAFKQAIAEIPLCSDKIRFSVLDAREGFNREGPDSGPLIRPGIIIAGSDLAAVDAVGLALLKITDTTLKLKATRVWDHPTIRRGAQVLSPGLSSGTLSLVSEGIDAIAEIRRQLL
ncbi:MAG: DUF362 domain-containing protein [Pseudomonadota bacterium]